MDSANNKHHCLRDLAFFPGGVRQVVLSITGAHGKQDVKVGIGTAQFLTECSDGSIAEWSFPNTIHNPSSPVDLLCMDLFHFHNGCPAKPTGHTVEFRDNELTLKSGRKCRMPRNESSRLYELEILPRALHDPRCTMLFKNTQLRRLSTRSALQRLGYPLEEHFNLTLKHGMLKGIEQLAPASTGVSKQRDDAFYHGKHTQRQIPHFSNSGHYPTCPGSDIYSDIAGPFPVPTREGHKYFVLYKCGRTQHQCAYLTKTKDQLLDTWKQYIADMRRFNKDLPVDKNASLPPGVLRFRGDPQYCIHDDEQVYVAGEFAKFNRDHLVGQWTICPYTHSANPAEPAIRRVVESALACLHRSGLPPSFLLYAVLHAVEAANRCYTSVHYCSDDEFKTPHERRFNFKPHIDDCPPFGCKSIVDIATGNRPKGAYHAWVGFYAGPTHNMNGFRIFRPLNNACYDRYHVTFDSTVMYGDFMGQAFKERARADKLQREYYNSEVDVMLGITPSSNPLLDLLTQPSHVWERVPAPAPAPQAQAQAQPPAQAQVQAQAQAQQAQAQAQPQPQPPPPPPQVPLAPAVPDLPILDPLVDQFGVTAPIQAIARLREQMNPTPFTPPPRVLRSQVRAAKAAVAADLLRGVPRYEEPPQASPAVAPHSPALTAPRRVLQGDAHAPVHHNVRTALYAAAQCTSDLCDEIFGDNDTSTPPCMLFSDPDFISDLAHCDFDSDEVLMLQLCADASQSQAVSYLAAQVTTADPTAAPLHDQTRFVMDAATSKKIADTPPPTTPSQLAALKGTTEGNLILEAQVDEVLSMIREGRVLPVDKRNLAGRVHEMDGKWVVKYKKKLNGLLERVRARWTLRGDRQIPGRDYDPDNIYSPVATKTTHFAIFVLAVQYSLMLFCLDVSKAFMMGPIDKPGIYMRPPFGFAEQVHPDFCPFGDFTTYELLCSLYGLKQAAAVYYATVKALVLAYRFPDGSSFILSKADPCAFMHGSLAPESNHYIAFSTHIDDKFIACKTVADRDVVKSIFDSAGWKYTLQAMDQVLGVTIDYVIYNPNTKQGGKLQLGHTTTITDAYNKYSAKAPKDKQGPKTLPVTSQVVAQIVAKGPTPPADYDKDRHTLFRSILGTISHIANFTHPEIAFAVSFASQFMANPSADHLQLVFDILFYLYGAKDKKITFKRQNAACVGSPISVLCDADLGNSHWANRSRTGIVAYLFGNLVYWQSRLQPSVSLSTSEAEYMALAAAGRFAVWFKMLMGDLGVVEAYHLPAKVYSDNLAAAAIAKTPITHKHSRHIDRRLHWLREVVTATGPVAPQLDVAFVASPENCSDIMTKALPVKPMRKHRDSLFDGYTFRPNASIPDHSAFLMMLEEDISTLLMMMAM